jgi:tetratricopeptide (TPR) repeat protein
MKPDIVNRIKSEKVGRFLLAASFLLALILTGIMQKAILALRVNTIMRQVTSRTMLHTSFVESASKGPDIWARDLTDELRPVRSALGTRINAVVTSGTNSQLDDLCRLKAWFDISEVKGGPESRVCRDNEMANVYRGTWSWAQGKKDEAILYWQRTQIAERMEYWAYQLVWTNRSMAFEWASLAHKVDPNGSAYFTLQVLFGIDGQWDKSLEAYQCLVDNGTADVQAHRLAAGAILYGSGDLRRALQTFFIIPLRLPDQDSKDLNKTIADAVLLYESDRNKSDRVQVLNGNTWAITRLWNMGWRSPDSQLPPLYLLLGNAFESVGDVPQAIEWYQRLVQVAPTDCNSHRFLEHAYNLVGNEQLDSYERSLLQHLCTDDRVGW